MKIFNSFLALAATILNYIAWYKVCVKIYIGNYYGSLGWQAVAREMIGSSGYMWGNVALLGMFILALSIIWCGKE